MESSSSSSSSSVLPWHWVIEALADLKEIPLSTLQDLIDASPLTDDDFSETTKDLIALRCLEELYASSSSSSSSTFDDSRVQLDSSRTCQDVLQQIFHEVPLSNLRTAGLEEISKWDVNRFISHKRANNVKCQLEKLKESILEGTLPLNDHLKQRSGLFQTNRANTICVNDGKCAGNSTYAEGTRAKQNSVSLILEDGNQSSKERFPDNNNNNNCLSSKRNRVYSANEDQVCINECDDSLRSTKRIKCYHASNNFVSKEKQVSQLGKDLPENSTEKMLLISENVGHRTEKNNRETVSDGSLEDNHNRCAASNLCQSIGQNEDFHDESDIPINATLKPQLKTSESKPWSEHEPDLHLKGSNGSLQTVRSDKSQDAAGNGCGIEISGDTTVSQSEKINLVMKRRKEKSLDTKCNKGGQLLVSEATTVPLLVPESCIGMKTNIHPLHTSGVEPETNDTVHAEPIPTNDGNANKVQHMINESQPKQKEQNVASLNVSQKAVASDKAVADTVNDFRAELSSDSDGYHNEKIDLKAKKDEFLSSQHAFGQDLPAMTESTGQNLCIRCNEAGHLLVCKTTTCSLMVHEYCLGDYAQLDAKGNFLCPFCEYSHTTSEYLEAKKIASLARKELAIFISKGSTGNKAVPGWGS